MTAYHLPSHVTQGSANSFIVPDSSHTHSLGSQLAERDSIPSQEQVAAARAEMAAWRRLAAPQVQPWQRHPRTPRQPQQRWPPQQPELSELHPSNGPRGHAAVGSRIAVYWRAERPPTWFKGVVKQFDSATGEHLVRSAHLEEPAAVACAGSA